MEIFVSLPVAGLEEGRTIVEAKDIREAAENAIVVWR